ncbi:MAG: hypothetical protein JO112_09850 [Planctomycetes bacterium]|nr:hypothetical protein [Planctomycetota bacterium]
MIPSVILCWALACPYEMGTPPALVQSKPDPDPELARAQAFAEKAAQNLAKVEKLCVTTEEREYARTALAEARIRVELLRVRDIQLRRIERLPKEIERGEASMEDWQKTQETLEHIRKLLAEFKER